MGTTNGLKIFALPGEVSKDSESSELFQQYPKLWALLDACPVLAFSPVGINNICKRFHITEKTLEDCIQAFLSLTYTDTFQEWVAQDLALVTKPAPELLETIRKAITPKPRRKPTTKPKVKEGRNNG